MTAELHRCHRGARCVNSERLEGVRLGQKIAASEGLCPSCERVVDSAIRALPADYVQLSQQLAKVKRAGGVPVSGSRELPVPIDLGTEALLADIVRESVAWATSVSEVLGAPLTASALRGYRDAVLVAFAAETLAGHLAVLLALRDVVHLGWIDGVRTVVEHQGYEGAEALLALHERTRAYSGQVRLVHRLPAPCPECERVALVREDGDETVECSACAHRMSWDDYSSLVSVLSGGLA